LANEGAAKSKDEQQNPKTESDTDKSSLTESDSDNNELRSLRIKNARLESKVQRLTNLVDLTAWKSYKELPLGDEEDIMRKLEDKEEELQAVRDELIIAKSVPTSPEIGVLDGRSELDSELDKINLLKENEVTENFLNEELKKSSQVQEELWLMGLEVKELKGEKLQLEALLREKELNRNQQLQEALQDSEKRFREEITMREEEVRRSIEGELSAAKLAYDTLLKEVVILRREREWIMNSKMSTISSLSYELERLRSR